MGQIRVFWPGAGSLGGLWESRRGQSCRRLWSLPKWYAKQSTNSAIELHGKYVALCGRIEIAGRARKPIIGTETSSLGWEIVSFATVKIAVYGDADLSGAVGASDLSAVLSNFAQTLPSYLDISPYCLDADAIGALTSAGITVAPEPGMLVLLAAALAGLLFNGRLKLIR
jgi:hypothetical protein